MTTMTRHATHAAFTRATRPITAGFGAVRAQMRARADYRRLIKMDDHLLNDVGLARSDIMARLRWNSVLPMQYP